MRKFLTFVLLLTMLASSLASCTSTATTEAPQAPQATQPPASPTEAPKPTEAPPPTQAVSPTEAPKPTEAPAVSQPLAGKEIEILGPWGGLEQEALMKVLKPFEDKTGIKINYDGTRDVAFVKARAASGNPPDFYISPIPAIVWEFAADKKLVALDSFMDMNELKSSFSADWLKLGSEGGHLYGIFGPVTIKSLVWYAPKVFKENGWEIPKTWEEMLALSDKIAASGKTPWSIAMGSGDATGWVGTDWIEDIMLRTVGPDVYDQWVAHEISWTDPRVKTAWETFGKIGLDPKYVFGGTQGELSVDFGDGADPVYTNPPNAYMHRQALFIYDFIRKHFPNLKPGEDIDFFQVPPIDPKFGNPAEAAGEQLAMFNDRPETREFMKYWASPEAQTLIVENFGRLSANNKVPASTYNDPLLLKGADLLKNATSVRFDGSDLMPSAIGAGAFWTGVVDYVSGKNLDDILKTIEDASKDAYAK